MTYDMTTHADPTTDTPGPDAADDNHISSVRRMLIDQMRALRNANSPEALQQENARAKSVALVAQAVTGVARVELDYAKKIYASKVKLPFLEHRTGPAAPTAPSAPTVATCWVQPVATIAHAPESA